MKLFQCAFKRLVQEHTMHFYAVARGHKIGIYDTWAKCEKQVKGFKNAKYKKFPTRQEAEAFINTVARTESGSAQFKPEEIAVALGKNGPGSSNWFKEPVAKETTQKDYWPEDDNGTDMSEADLLTAMDEVEGFSDMPTVSKKRPIDDTETSGTKHKHPKHESKIWEPAGMIIVRGFEFLIDSEGYVIVYTDGSCTNNGQKNACAGFGVYFGQNHSLNAAKPVIGRVTNNVGEIQAAIYAIKTAQDLGITKLCISTDSQFLINSITLWVKSWKRNGWRLKSGEPVKNVEDFKELDELLENDDILVKWNYVKAHKGIHGNEMADKLANEGSEIYRRMHLQKS